MEFTEMSMLRGMCDNTIMDKIRNQDFRKKLGVAPFSAKMCENKLRWFGHVQRKTHDAQVRRIKIIMVEGKRSRGRLKRTWEDHIKSDVFDYFWALGKT